MMDGKRLEICSTILDGRTVSKRPTNCAVGVSFCCLVQWIYSIWLVFSVAFLNQCLVESVFLRTCLRMVRGEDVGRFLFLSRDEVPLLALDVELR